MEKNVYRHEIIVLKGSYDILSADTEFYAFIGQERLYNTFDKFVFETDREVFSEEVEKLDGEPFMLHLVKEDGDTQLYVTAIRSGANESSVIVNLISLNDCLSSLENFDHYKLICNDFFKMHNELAFRYIINSDILEIYKNNIFVPSESGGIDEFRQKLMSKVDEDELEKAGELISNLLLGTISKEYVFNSDILGVESENQTGAKTYIYMNPLSDSNNEVIGYISCSGVASSASRYRTEKDSLTGLCTRGNIIEMARELIDQKREKGTAIAIVDVDNFKRVNDTYGHMQGDQVLKTVSEIMLKEVDSSGQVGRIGGDEFMIIFYNTYDMEMTREKLRSIKNIVNATFPEGSEESPNITLSIGCASFPKDADTYEDIFKLADFALYRAKNKGRNRYIIYNKEKHGSLEEIESQKLVGDRIDVRNNLAKGDIICAMFDRLFLKKDYPIEKILDDFVVNFGIQRLMLYGGDGTKLRYMAGERRPDDDVIEKTESYINDEQFRKLMKEFNRSVNGGINVNDSEVPILIVNDIRYFQGKNDEVYLKLVRQGVLSMLQVVYNDKVGKQFVLSLESVSSRVTWDMSQTVYYRLFARLLAMFEI